MGSKSHPFDLGCAGRANTNDSASLRLNAPTAAPAAARNRSTRRGRWASYRQYWCNNREAIL